MTEEQQGGTAPDTEATASVEPQAPDQPAGAIAVADEPVEATGAEATTDTEATTVEASTEATAADGSSPEVADPEPASNEDGAADADATATVEVDAATAPAEGETPDAAPADTPAPADETATPDAPASTADAIAPVDTEAEAAEPQASRSADPDAPAEPATAEAAAAAEPEPEPVAPPRVLGPEPTTMEELLAEQDTDIKSLKHGDVVEGNVVRIDKDEILVDIGAKSEGVVSNRELFGRHGGEGQAPLNIGDTVLVYVLQPESPEGHAVLSLRRAGLERKWRAMQEQFEAGVIIEAPVIDHNKGGLIVDCGIRGFVPISQIVDFPRRPQNDQPRDAAQEIAEKLHAVRRPQAAAQDPRGQPQGEPPHPVREGRAVRGAPREARRAVQQPAGRPEGHRHRPLDRAVRRVHRPRRHRRPRPQERALVEQGQQPRVRLQGR